MINNIYREWLNLEDPNESLYCRIKELMQMHNLNSVSWGTDHKAVMASLFMNWSNEQSVMAYSDLTKAYDAFFELYKDNRSYFIK